MLQFDSAEDEARFKFAVLGSACIPFCLCAMSLFGLGFGASAASGQQTRTSVWLGLGCVALLGLSCCAPVLAGTFGQSGARPDTFQYTPPPLGG